MYIDQKSKQQTLEVAGRFGIEEDDYDDPDMMNGNIMAGGAGITPPSDPFNNPSNYLKSMMPQIEQTPVNNRPRVTVNLEDAVL